MCKTVDEVDEFIIQVHGLPGDQRYLVVMNNGETLMAPISTHTAKAH